MKRWFRLTLVVLALSAAAALTGCSPQDPQAERQKEDAAAEEQREDPTTIVEAPEPVGMGETAEVDPFAVTLNSATRTAGDGDRYAVVDLTLENRSQRSADASDADYLLRDAEGYSFETGSAPDQRPRPEGQVEPRDKASGQVGFELGGQPADGPLELTVSLSNKPQTARFEFEAEEEKKPEPEPEAEPEAAQKEVAPAPSARPGYSLVEDPSGSLSVEVPSSWSSQTGSDSEGQGGNWSSYAGEYLTASITTANSLDAWYVAPGSVQASGAYLVASETLAKRYTNDDLIYSLLNEKRATNCTTGPSQTLERSPFSGKVQTWFDCNGTGSTSYTFAAAPEGRACVVVGGARIDQGASEADQEAVQHIVDNFEVDCGALPPPAPLASSATASASASAEAAASGPSSASQSPSAEAETSSCGDFRTMSGEPSQWQAQQYYDFVATPEEKAILDPDGDGFACEDVEPGVGGTDEEGDASPEPDDSSPDPGTPAPEEPSTAPPDSSGPVNCDGVNGPIPTPPGDPNNLDGDGDGQACE